MMKILITEKDIARKVDELAQAIQTACPKDLVMVGVLNGAFLFTADLSRALWKAGMKELIVDFVAVSSYGSGTESSRNPHILKDLSLDISGRNILLVEDIVETGLSLNILKKLLKDRGATSVWTCVLLDKPGKREVPCSPDFVGFTISDKVWVEGYGLDTDGKGRGNPDIIVR